MTFTIENTLQSNADTIFKFQNVIKSLQKMIELIRKIAWVLRICSVITISCVIFFNLFKGVDLNDPLIVYSTLMPIMHLLYCLLVGFSTKILQKV